MKDQIAKIITDYLNKIEVPKEKWDGTVGFFPAEWPLPTCTIADEIAEKLAAAIAPHLEAGVDLPYSELFGHMSNEHGLTLTNTELGDIIHVARATPVPRVGEELKIGDRVEIIALLDHSPAYGHEAPIGYEGYITAIDSADFELPYQVDMLHWVSRGEIKLI